MPSFLAAGAVLAAGGAAGWLHAATATIAQRVMTARMVPPVVECAFSLTDTRMSTACTLTTAVVATLVTACAPATPSLDAIGVGYTQAALRLAQHDPSLVEAWRGPGRLEPGPRGPVKQVAAEIAALLDDAARAGADISSAEDQARLRYLTFQLNALRYAADQRLGRAASVEEQAKEEFALELPPFDASAVQRSLAEIAKLLPAKGTLAERVFDLRRSIRVPREKRREVFEAALSACKDVSAPVFPLPAQEEVEIRISTFGEHKGADGLANHTGDLHTQIWINDEVPLDVSRALRLACHEGYPGHHVQHVMIDQLFESRQWMELRLTPAFGRYLLLTEGAAEVASDLAFSAEQRATLYREKLFPAAEVTSVDAAVLVRVEDLQRELLPVITDVARGYLANTITKTRALERLANEALVADADVMLSLIERQRARALVYGEGRRLIYSLLPSRDLAGLRALMRSTTALQ